MGQQYLTAIHDHYRMKEPKEMTPTSLYWSCESFLLTKAIEVFFSALIYYEHVITCNIHLYNLFGMFLHFTTWFRSHQGTLYRRMESPVLPKYWRPSVPCPRKSGGKVISLRVQKQMNQSSFWQSFRSTTQGLTQDPKFFICWAKWC